jgi:hypothetical protein
MPATCIEAPLICDRDAARLPDDAGEAAVEEVPAPVGDVGCRFMPLGAGAWPGVLSSKCRHFVGERGFRAGKAAEK